MTTPRERWIKVLNGEKPDRVPCDFWSTSEVMSRLFGDLGCSSERELWEHLNIDRLVPIYPSATNPATGSKEVWGLDYREVSYRGGEGVYLEVQSHPLSSAETVADVENYPWPSPAWWDVSDLRARCEEWTDYPIIGGEYEPFYLYCSLRGMERAMEDLVLNPAIVEAALDRIFWIHESIFRRTLDEIGDRIQLMEVSEDLGQQRSLLMSPEAFRKFLKPNMERMTEIVHSHGVKVLHHDDGAIRPIIPDLIDIGIDVLNPIQWRCSGMEREGLARDFGADLVFHGGIDVQQTLPLGTPQDVRDEVAESIRIFSNCRGYILTSCHRIQTDVPAENILAMYGAAEEFGGLE